MIAAKVITPRLSRLVCAKHFFSSTAYPKPDPRLPEPYPDLAYLTNPGNRDIIAQNVVARKGIGDVDKVQRLHSTLERDPENNALRLELIAAALQIPNKTHPEVVSYGEDPKVCKEIKWSPKFELPRIRPFEEIAKIVTGLRNDNLSHFCGEKAYFLLHQLAELEQALIAYTVDQLSPDFELISVPDLLHPDVIERCGMPVRDDRTQVYTLEKHYGEVALSGTSEMALAGYFAGKVLKTGEERKMMAVSRCFRAETSKRMVEKGIYRQEMS